MVKKKLQIDAEFSSIFRDSKWLVGIDIVGFSSRRREDNRKLLKGVIKLVGEYNKVNQK